MHLLALLVAVFAVGCSGSFVLQGVADANAKCNDGSPYKFYIDAEKTDPSHWLIHYQVMASASRND